MAHPRIWLNLAGSLVEESGHHRCRGTVALKLENCLAFIPLLAHRDMFQRSPVIPLIQGKISKTKIIQ